jgi:hypothetical protein
VAPLRLFRPLFIAGLLAISAAAAPATAQDSGLRLAEQAIKAGLIYNFLHYTRWPASRAGPIQVCVYGDDPLEGRLDPIARRTINQRAIQLRNPRAASESSGCDLLVVSAGERQTWPQIRTALGDRAVLTVGDFEGFAESGGMVEFTHGRDHIGMRINVDALARAGLSMEDRLLVLADTSSTRRR